ncbi:hypothetical protein [Oenococcus oeni]|uniref:hypothetical protein n=1 Tax=Oenococcus oeni TaxID=1247 RepID=UPI0010B5E5DC|nr:hypothetical protein [Oenococcus oeni]SYW16236.1 hypothetical protein OENI_30068 [Oenococcus oeni]
MNEDKVLDALRKISKEKGLPIIIKVDTVAKETGLSEDIVRSAFNKLKDYSGVHEVIYGSDVAVAISLSTDFE